MILIFSEHSSERLRYIAEVLCQLHFGMDFKLSSDKEQFAAADAIKINYSRDAELPGLRIIPSGLLSEKGIKEQAPRKGEHQGIPLLFPNEGKRIPFDLFSACFYMLSRYEEYLPFKADSLGRFPAEESLAYKEGFIKLPVVDIWSNWLRTALLDLYPKAEFNKVAYSFKPTVDIDNAWAYRHKGLMRTIGGFAKDLVDWNMENLLRRVRVLTGREKDPYDTFDQMRELHQKYKVQPVYFFLLADYGHNDKSIPFGNPAFQRLVRSEADEVEVGIHPGFMSNYRSEKLGIEVARLQELTHREVVRSRQHFLMLSMPDTYRRLVEQGIREDHTMGFASRAGFRAGTARSFPFFDLDRELTTPLMLRPFAAMDATLNRYMKLSVEESLQELKELRDVVRDAGGEFITLWHNETLGEIWEWKGWNGVYEEVLKIGTCADTSSYVPPSDL